MLFPCLLQTRLFQNAVCRSFWQFFVRVGDCDLSFFAGVFKMVMATRYADQISAVFFNQPDQFLARINLRHSKPFVFS